MFLVTLPHKTTTTNRLSLNRTLTGRKRLDSSAEALLYRWWRHSGEEPRGARPTRLLPPPRLPQPRRSSARSVGHRLPDGPAPSSVLRLPRASYRSALLARRLTLTHAHTRSAPFLSARPSRASSRSALLARRLTLTYAHTGPAPFLSAPPSGASSRSALQTRLLTLTHAQTEFSPDQEILPMSRVRCVRKMKGLCCFLYTLGQP